MARERTRERVSVYSAFASSAGSRRVYHATRRADQQQEKPRSEANGEAEGRGLYDDSSRRSEVGMCGLEPKKGAAGRRGRSQVAFSDSGKRGR